MPLNDQMRLLQTSWPEVLTLSLAFRSIPVNSSNPKLQWSADFSMNEKEARECGMEELFFQVRKKKKKKKSPPLLPLKRKEKTLEIERIPTNRHVS